MKYHILNGDVLLEKARSSVNGQFIVIRECLIEGEVHAKSLEDFWKRRAAFMEQVYGISPEDYFSKSVLEINKIQTIPENSSVYLWFERDLFCQINLWFTVYYLKKLLAQKNLYPFLILPNHDKWTGFGSMSAEDLIIAYDQKITLKKEDIQLFSDAWEAYQQHDLDTLTQLSLLTKKRFPYLVEVVQAHKDRFAENNHPNRPYKIIKEIINDLQTTHFGEVFKEFCKRGGVYGFGDLQFRRIYDQVLKENSL